MSRQAKALKIAIAIGIEIEIAGELFIQDQK